MLLDSLSDISSIATAVGVLVGAYHLTVYQRQARTDFEDAVAKEFRDLLQALPADAYLGKPLHPDVMTAHLNVFIRYFDLCNNQVFYWQQRRVTAACWINWQDGICGLMKKPAFRQAWEHMMTAGAYTTEDFIGLRELFKARALPLKLEPPSPAKVLEPPRAQAEERA